ncbi:hypothetical protein [Bifidobacterium dentium]|uniref:hypothetical protein n=1 Tax=Bifidobacterium dentium TaxID=1689 RepID=UPI003D171991
MTDILNPPAPPKRDRLFDPDDIHFMSEEHALVNFWYGKDGSLNMHTSSPEASPRSSTSNPASSKPSPTGCRNE